MGAMFDLVKKSYGVFGVRHGIERTKFHRELVDDEVVGVVFGFDDSSEALLVFRA